MSGFQSKAGAFNYAVYFLIALFINHSLNDASIVLAKITSFNFLRSYGSKRREEKCAWNTRLLTIKHFLFVRCWIDWFYQNLLEVEFNSVVVSCIRHVMWLIFDCTQFQQLIFNFTNSKPDLMKFLNDIICKLDISLHPIYV